MFQDLEVKILLVALPLGAVIALSFWPWRNLAAAKKPVPPADLGAEFRRRREGETETTSVDLKGGSSGVR